MNVGTVTGQLRFKDEFSVVYARAAAQVQASSNQINNALNSVQTTMRASAASAQAAANGLRQHTAAGKALSGTLTAQIQGLRGLLAAYERGESAVTAYNQQQRIAAELARVGVTAESLQGRAIAARVLEVEKLTAAIQRQAMAQAQAASAPKMYTPEGKALKGDLDAEIASLKGLSAAYERGQKAVAEYNLQQRITAELARVNVRAESMQGRAISDRIRQIDQLNAAITRQKSSVSGAASMMTTSFKGLFSALFNIRSLIYGIGLGTLASEMIQAQRSADQMRNSLLAVIPSTTGVAKELEFVRGEASRLGLDFQTAGKSFAWLAAASNNTGMSMADVRKIFTATSTAATALGLSADTTAGAFNAMVQMMTKGTVQAEELRGQLGDRIPGAIQAAARALGMGTDELNKMLKKGEVLATDLLPKLADEFMALYGNAAQSAAASLNAEINRLSTATYDLFIALSKGIDLTSLVRSVGQAMRDIAEAFQTESAQAGLRQLGEVLATVAKVALGALVVVVENIDLIIAAIKAWYALKFASFIMESATALNRFSFEARAAAASVTATGEAAAGAGRAVAAAGGPFMILVQALIAIGIAADSMIDSLKSRMQTEIDNMVRAAEGTGKAAEVVRAIYAQLAAEGHAAFAKISEDQQSFLEGEIESIKKQIEEIRRLRSAANAQLADMPEGGFLQEKLSKDVAGFTEQIGNLLKRWQQLRDAMNLANVETEDTAQKNGELSESYQELIQGLQREIAANKSSAAAWGLTLDAREKMLDSIKVSMEYAKQEQALQSSGIAVTKEMAAAIRGLIAAKIESARTAVGAETIANLKLELEAQRQLLAARQQGQGAYEAMNRQLELEARIRQETAKASESQRAEIEKLIRSTAAMNEAEIKLAASQEANLAVSKKAAEMFKALDKAALDAARGGIKDLVEGFKNVTKLEAEVANQKDLAAAFQQGKKAYEDMLLLVKQREAIERLIPPTIQKGTEDYNQLAERIKSAVAQQHELETGIGKIMKDWAEFQRQVKENFIREVQGALADFFVAAFEGGEDAMKSLGDALKKLLFKVLAEYLAQWIVTQAQMLAVSLARIAKEKIAQQAANAAGGGGTQGIGPVSSGTQYANMLQGGGSTALYAVAAMAAVVAIAKWSNDQNSKKIYGTTAGGSMQDGQFTGSWSGKLDQTGPQVWNALKGLVEAIQQGTGALLSGINQAQIKIRNDKKFFEAVVNNEVIGRFRTAEEAIVAAAKAMFTKGDLSREIAPEIQQVLQNFRGKSTEELAKAISTVQGILDKVAGLTDIEIALRELPAKAAQLTAQLREMGVSMEDAASLSQQWRVNEMNSLRDQITGHQRTQAEEMALRQRQAAMFNAELTMMRIELEEKKAALEAKKALLTGDRALQYAQAEMAKANLNMRAQFVTNESSLYRAQEGIGNGYLKAQGDFNKFLGNMYGQELTIRETYAEYSQDIIDSMLANLNEQIAAMDAALANLPELIDPKEIKLGGGGGSSASTGGGGASGPSKKELREQLLDEIEQVARSLESDLLQQLMNLDDWLAEMTQRATALGIPLDQINELYARQREELIATAQAEVQQYTGNPLMTQLEGIRVWAEQMREVYAELGLSLEQVNEAEQQRINDLLAEAYAILGIPGADIVAKYEQMADALAFLQSALDQGIISAEDYASAIEQAGMAAYASMIDTLLQYVDNEDARRQLEQIRYDLAIAQLMLEFELLKGLEILTKEQIALIEGLIKNLPDAPPIDLGGGSSGGYYGGGGYDGGDTNAAMDALRRAIERLTDYYESLIQDTSVSPLSLQDRFAAAQQEYQDLQSQIAWWLAHPNHPDYEENLALLYDQLPDVAQQYLELAAQMFGTATAGYQEIFQSVLDYIEGILGAYNEPDQWDWLRVHMTDFRGRFASIDDQTFGTYDRLGDIIGLLSAPATPPAAPPPVESLVSGGGLSSSYTVGSPRTEIGMLSAAIKSGATMTVEALYDTQESNARELQGIRSELKVKPSAAERRAQAIRRSAI